MHIIEIHIFVLVVRIAGEQILWRLFNYPITAAPSAVREINLNAKIFADGTLNISILKSMRKWAWHVEDGGGGGMFWASGWWGGSQNTNTKYFGYHFWLNADAADSVDSVWVLFLLFGFYCRYFALFANVICLLFLGLWFLPTHAILWSIKTVNGSKYRWS